MTEYTDPTNAEELVQQMKDIQTEDQLRSFMEDIFPGWLVGTSESYSKDYPHLTGNWKKICHLLGTTPKLIVFVDYIAFDREHKLLNLFCEIMTQRGYVVRRKEEFIICKVCNAVIPDKEVWAKLKEGNIDCPDIWSDTCQGCQ